MKESIDEAASADRPITLDIMWTSRVSSCVEMFRLKLSAWSLGSDTGICQWLY